MVLDKGFLAVDKLGRMRERIVKDAQGQESKGMSNEYIWIDEWM